VTEPLVEGERVVVVVTASRVISSTQNFSIVSNGTKHLTHLTAHAYPTQLQDCSTWAWTTRVESMAPARRTAFALRTNAPANKDGLVLIVKCEAKPRVPCLAAARALAAAAACALATPATTAVVASTLFALNRPSKLIQAASSTARPTVHFR
jgi:hypothetical protein